jgi:hypothetical protein
MAIITTGNTDYSVVSFDEAIDKVLDERRTRHDFQIPLKDFSLSLDADGENIVGTIDGIDYIPTMHCLKQMATVMGVSHAVLKQYLNPVTKTKFKDKIPYDVVRYERDATDRELLVALFKNGIRDGRVDPEKEFKFRTYTDGTLRAMLSDSYAIIDNVWYINQLRDTFKQIGGEEPGFVHWRGNADTVIGNLLIPDSLRYNNDSDYGGMISTNNCEIGTRRLSMLPSIFRGLCSNGMIFGLKRLSNKISRVHRGNVDLGGLATSIHDAAEELVPMMGDGIEQFVQMTELGLDVKPSRMIAQIAQDHALTTGSKGQALASVNQYVEHERANPNLFGIVNAITRAAQEFDPTENLRLDEIAGKLMEHDESSWDSYNKRAAGLSDAQMNKIYGRVAA